jgi:hypothetical protein
MGAYDQLLLQIEDFIKRFYMNRLIKGLLLFSALLILAILFFSSLEFFGRFNSILRAFLFFSFLLLVGWAFYRYVVDPFLKLNKLGRRLTPFQASRLIGQLFPSVSDAVLNTLQLQQSSNIANIELLKAAIDQKAAYLNTFSFSNAIPLKDNKKYLKLVLPLVFLFLLVLFLTPSLIRNGSTRLINFSRVFVEPAPFQFVWLNQQKQLEEGNSAEIKIKLTGNQFPEKVFIESTRGKFLLHQIGKNLFSYTFSDLHESLHFYFSGGGFHSADYSITVFGSASLKEVQVKVDYPAYTQLKDELLVNPIMASLPEGTKLTFSVRSDNVSSSRWTFVDTVFTSQSSDYQFVYKAFKSQTYAIELKNTFTKQKSHESRFLQLIPDAYPSIEITEQIDSTNEFLRYFNGLANDDYGVRSVYFCSQIVRNKVPMEKLKTHVDGVSSKGGAFYFYLDIAKLHLAADDVLEYYFVVNDNDGIHGSKSTVSQKFTFHVPSLEEMSDNRNNALNEASDGISSAQQELSLFQKKWEELRKANLQKEDPFSMKQRINDLQQERESIENRLKNLNEKLKNSINQKQLFDSVSPELMKKQALLNEMLDKVMDDELKKLLNELSELLNKNKNNDFESKMEQMKLSNEELNRKMDRAMEMLKRLQLDEKLAQAINDLNKLSVQQKELNNELKQNGNMASYKHAQDSIQKQFQKISKDLDSIKKLNDNLDNPTSIDTQKEMQEQTKSSLQNARDNLNKGNKSKAGENQQNAAEQMQELATSLQKQQEENNTQKEAEDINTIRNLLKNLLYLSFHQEDLYNDVAYLKPQMSSIVNHYPIKQLQLQADFVPVKDSLIALSKRVPQVSKLIDDNIGIIDRSFLAIQPLWENETYRDISTNMRQIITSYNDIALMLNESLQQMQSNMRQKSGGSGSCSKPGGSKPKSNPGGSLEGMKEALKKQLQQMKNGQNGEGGEGKNGKDGSMPGGMNNEQIAKMAAEQGAIRQALEQLRQELNSEGDGLGDALNPLIKELENQQKDLVNKKFDNLYKRQQEIMTRMLESEKAIKEREFDNKRESKEGKNNENSNLIPFLEYKRKKEAELDLLRNSTPSLNQYYKQRADAYFINLRKND